MPSIEELLERFIDDRDALAEEELDALVEAASADPQFAERLKDQLVVDELLAQQLAVDRRNFPAQVRQRIRDAHPPTAAAASEVESEPVDEALAGEMLRLADVEFAERQQHAQRQRTGRALWLSACALLLAAAAGAWWWQQNRAALGVLTSVSGAPNVVSRGQPQTARVGAAIHQGDQLVTHPGETMALRYSDGTTLELLGDTSLQLRSGRGNSAKDVVVAWGSIAADVRPQPTGALMQFDTPLAIATVRGTRLRLSADSSRTRLDVLEGVVQLARKADRAQVNVQSQEFAVATVGELSVKPLAWPVDRRDAVVILETGDPATPCLVRHAATRQLRTVTPQARGRARLDHHFAWILRGGAYAVPEAGRALRSACRTTSELTLEVTITPDHLEQSGPARIVTCSRDSHEYNFTLGQEGERLIFRLRTSDEGWQSEDIELCRLSAGQAHHVAVAYRPGELVCYLNGRRVYHDVKLRGGLGDWQPHELLLGDDAAAERNWAGTLAGLAIYDRFLDEEEIARNAQQFGELLAQRASVPQIEVAATLVAQSAMPTPESISPQRAALVVSRYRVDEVIRGDLTDSEVLVAQWAVLDGQAQPPATLAVGRERRLTLGRLGLNPQLAGVARSDDFHTGDDPERPRYYEVSDP